MNAKKWSPSDWFFHNTSLSNPFNLLLGLSDICGNVDELRKSLPHVDLETGLKNRDFNKTLLSWDADTAAPISNSGKTTPRGSSNLGNVFLVSFNDRNIITGESCTDFDISEEMKPVGPRRRSDAGKNTITGENCSTYDVNVENAKTGRARVRARSESKRINPLSGENVSAFTISKEEKKRPTKPYVYTNAVTGENCQSYKITPIERNVTARPNTAPSNPLLGENTQHYKYRVGEKEKSVKSRDISSPLTGPGSRGTTYSISVEERRRQPSTANSTRNVLTGENCSTYQICQEMRSERKSSAPPTPRGIQPSYCNPRLVPFSGCL
ncbi:unnamed protein product [Mesocestoides corti]|uniref:Uncharacterized protein n=1 Tax=Mesocestoides corti TaxID=53468 RepID=A0A3P6H148_MESCO|nr:unnamed protein product [Mesocestoides corti]